MVRISPLLWHHHKSTILLPTSSTGAPASFPSTLDLSGKVFHLCRLQYLLQPLCHYLYQTLASSSLWGVIFFWRGSVCCQCRLLLLLPSSAGGSSPTFYCCVILPFWASFIFAIQSRFFFCQSFSLRTTSCLLAKIMLLLNDFQSAIRQYM